MKLVLFVITALGVAGTLVACSGTSNDNGTDSSGGSPSGESGGATPATSGGTTSTGGALAGGAPGAGGAIVGAGGALRASDGGVTGAGGASGGAGASGGSSGLGGATAAGGSAGSGGSTGGSGGASTGGASAGGSGGAGGAASITGPCDIYATGNTPCVAAHSMTRALYGAYGGRLYQVRRASDKTTKDIMAMSPGGVADSASQDAFCSGTTCTVSIVYDQSSKGNHLTKAPAGGYKNTPDNEANATALKLMLGGHTVYAAFIEPGIGYRNDKTSGIATKDQPEGEYMVTSGKHFNGGCCFDYGNAETSNNDDGNGTMEAIYFGNNTGWGKGSGNGPWVMADLENGLFAGTNGTNTKNTPITNDYVTALIKGKAGNFAIKGGNAQSGMLKTMYDGARPTPGYDPMKKQGAIILGIGGDNSNSAAGTFFEGCMTSGYPTDATEDAVQANIVAAGYGR